MRRPAVTWSGDRAGLALAMAAMVVAILTIAATLSLAVEAGRAVRARRAARIALEAIPRLAHEPLAEGVAAKTVWIQGRAVSLRWVLLPAPRLAVVLARAVPGGTVRLAILDCADPVAGTCAAFAQGEARTRRALATERRLWEPGGPLAGRVEQELADVGVAGPRAREVAGMVRAAVTRPDSPDS